ncbi:polyprenyl synthetase family protein [Aureibacillus halotolerans]|uniref:Farnesyl diphosphate synthase n=1 Tax=Aureibacillus halotolerans TaxID=1508390 RepID=A0A4R6U7I8_9BACI|nr:farnesyl diphosphate synthase [Aureibacillus halotolerans]TDQ41642.1 farnesyl-diphosphate synthase [Aureibacillus halotolerans]
MNNDLHTYLKDNKKFIDQALLNYLDQKGPASLLSAMTYSIKAGGKRLRPILMIATAEALGSSREVCVPVACALEMIHTYSLIHDDLPSMDNDDFRRGQPTNHKVYGEGMAILSGDALLTHAFYVLGEGKRFLDAETVLRLYQMLAEAAGPTGMVGGQVLDLEAEEQQTPLDSLENIHRNKTGALLRFSIIAGAIIGNASEEELSTLHTFAAHLGLAFQIKDDILDVEGDVDVIGKPIGSDEVNHKSTFPSLLTLDGAKQRLSQEVEMAEQALTRLHLSESSMLRAITHYMVQRVS